VVTFREFDLEQFENVVGKLGYKQVNVAKTKEYVFQAKPFEDKRFVVRIYSSIHKDTGVTRGKGKDAIRIIMFYKGEESAFVVTRFKRLHRTKNWSFNLSNRLKNIEYVFVSKDSCPRCGGGMLLRLGKYGHFYGCANFITSKCYGSMRITDGKLRRMAKELT
jgi:hypothetical protein